MAIRNLAGRAVFVLVLALFSSHKAKSFSKILMFVFLLALFTMPVSGAWYNTDYKSRINITFNNSASDENFTSFPVLIILNSSRINYSLTQNNGEDLRFVDDDETTLLSHEIDFWNETGDSFVWVKISLLENTTTDFIQMYYNNPGVGDGQSVVDVWSNNYSSVWHLGEDPSVAGEPIVNSVTDVYNGSTGGSMTASDLVMAQIGKGIDYDGNNDQITIVDGTQDLIDGRGNWSYSVWINPVDGLGSTQNNIIGDSSTADLYLVIRDNGELGYGNYFDENFGGVDTTAQPITFGSWNHVYFTRGNNNITWYVDGQYAESFITDINVMSTDGNDLQLGRYTTSTTFIFEGIMDEARISNTTRSFDWVEAEFNFQTEGHTTYESEEFVSLVVSDVVVTPTFVSNGSAVNISANVTSGQNIDTVLALFKYPDGTQFANYTMSLGGGTTYWNASYISTVTPMGNFTISIYANDTSGGLNDSESTEFVPYIDDASYTVISIDGTFSDWSSVFEVSDPEERGIVTNESWTMFQWDAQNTGSSSNNGDIDITKLRGTFTGPNLLFFGPSVWNGFVYIADNAGILYQLLEEDISKQVANFTAGNYISRFSPAIWEEYLYFGSGDSFLYQVNASNVSQLIASYDTGGPVLTGPTIHDGFVYMTSDDSMIYKFNASNISVINDSYDVVTQDITNAPAILNGFVYFAEENDEVYQLNASNMSQLIAKFDTGTLDIGLSSVSANEEYIYIGSQFRNLYQLNASNISDKIAEFATGSSGIYSTPVLSGDYVYLGVCGGESLFQLNASNISDEIQNKLIGSLCFTQPIVLGDYMYVGTDFDIVFKLNASNIADEIQQYDTGSGDIRAPLAVANGYLYAIAGDTLYQLGEGVVTLDIKTVQVTNDYDTAYFGMEMSGNRADFSASDEFYRVYISNSSTSGNGTTPEDNLLPVPYDYRMQVNSSTCGVYNGSDDYVADCSYNGSGKNLEIGIALTTLGLSISDTINVTWEVANSSYNDLGPDLSSFVSYILTDPIAPVITNEYNYSITSNSVIVNWSTDEPANSSVNYGTTVNLGTVNGTAGLTITHNITLSGLTAGTLYYYNVTSCDSAGNCNTTGPYSFPTFNDEPMLYDIQNHSFTDSSFIVNWSTNEIANSSVTYGTTVNLGSANGTAGLVIVHNITFSGLSEGTLYYYNVSSCDGSDNCNVTGPFSAATLNISPVISNVENHTITLSSTVVNWSTDELANSSVAFGTTMDLGSANRTTGLVMTHNITLTGLAEKTIYYYNVTSCDSLDNCNTTGSFNFTTLDGTPPVITDVQNHSITSSSAVVNWSTDELANSSVAFGMTVDLGSVSGANFFVSTHNITLSGLSEGTLYYYNVTSCDASNNCNTTGPFTFTSLYIGPLVINITTVPVVVPNGTSINVSANITDGNGIDTVLALFLYGNGTNFQNVTMSLGSGNIYWNASYVSLDNPLGNFTVFIYTNDTGGGLNDTEKKTFTPYLKYEKATRIVIDASFSDWASVLNITDALNDEVTDTSGGDWPIFMYDAARTGSASRKGPSNISTPYATFTTGADVDSSPVIWNGYVYVGSDDDFLYQLNASNISQMIASFETGADIFSSPAVGNGFLYIGSYDDIVYQLNASNVTQEIARFDSPGFWNVVSSPVVSGDYVYVGVQDDNLYQLNASNITQEIARYDTGFSDVDSSPAVANGFVYVGGDSYLVYRLNASNVSQLMESFTTGGVVVSSPAVANGFVYVGSFDTIVYQLNASNISQEIARYDTAGLLQTPPAVANGYVYIGGDDNILHQLNASNISQQIASFTTSGDIKGGASVAGEFLYIGSWDNNIYVLNASNVSQEIDRYDTGSTRVQSTPAVSGGFMYIGGQSNLLYQFGESFTPNVDFSSVSVVSDDSYIYSRFSIEGSNEFFSSSRTYRLYVSTDPSSGSSTTPEGETLPFPYDYRIQINNSVCYVYNEVGSGMGACSFANSDDEVELRASLSLMSLSSGDKANLTWETVNAEQRLDIAPDLSSFVELSFFEVISITSESATPSPVADGNIINASAIVTAGDGIDTVYVYLFYPNGTYYQSLTTTNSGNVYWNDTYSVLNEPFGNYTVKFWANTTVGNEKTSTGVDYVPYLSYKKYAEIVVDGLFSDWSSVFDINDTDDSLGDNETFDMLIAEIANNGTHLISRIKLDGGVNVSSHSGLRMYISNSTETGSNTTIAGNPLPFPYDYRVQINNSGCAVFTNDSVNLGTCMYANDSDEVEFAINLSIIGAAVNDILNVTWVMENDSVQYDMVPDMSSFVEYTLWVFGLDTESVIPTPISTGSLINVSVNVVSEGITIDTVLALLYYPNETNYQNLTTTQSGTTYYNDSYSVLALPLGNYTVRFVANETGGTTETSNDVEFVPYLAYTDSVSITIDGTFGDWSDSLSITDEVGESFPDESYTMFGYNVEKTRSTKNTGGNVSILNASYNIAGFDDIRTQPVISGGYVYFGSDNDNVYQLNESTLNLVSIFTTGGAVRSTPAIDNGYLYVGSYDDKVYQLNASDISQEIASFTAGFNVIASPAVFNGSVYVGVSHWSTSGFYQLNASNVSQQIANFTVSSGFDSSPAVSGGFVYVGNDNNLVYQLNASNVSQQIANFTTSADVDSSPAVSEGFVYVGSSSGYVYKLNASNISQQIGNFSSGVAVTRPITVGNGFVYFVVSSRLYQLNQSNISQQIANLTIGSVSFQEAAVVSGNYVYILSYQKLYQLNASNITHQISNYTTMSDTVYAAPAVANGFVYVGDGSNILYKFGQGILRNNDFEAVSVGNDGTNLYSRFTLNGTGDFTLGTAFYRLYISNSSATGSTTTPEGATLVFPYDYVAQVSSSTCAIYDSSEVYVATCTYSDDGYDLELNITLVDLGMTTSDIVNMTWETAGGVQFDIAPDLSSFVEYTVAAAGADSCTPPEIDNDWDVFASDNCILNGQSIDIGTGILKLHGSSGAGVLNLITTNITAGNFVLQGDGNTVKIALTSNSRLIR